MGRGMKEAHIDPKNFWRPIKEGLTNALIPGYLYMKLKINHKKNVVFTGHERGKGNNRSWSLLHSLQQKFYDSSSLTICTVHIGILPCLVNKTVKKIIKKEIEKENKEGYLSACRLHAQYSAAILDLLPNAGSP